jgi:GABA(A) receptor-associated protein
MATGGIFKYIGSSSKNDNGFAFQTQHDFLKRKTESGRIKSKYPDRIPIICEVSDKCDLVLDKKKYLVPGELSVGQFLYVIRKRIKLSPEKALYIFTEQNQLPPTASPMENIFRDNQNKDGFLYLRVSSESTFG